MKNKNKKNKQSILYITIVILIIVIFILIIKNLNNKTDNKKYSVTEQLEKTTDNAYVSMETHMSELNTKQQEIDNMQNKTSLTLVGTIGYPTGVDVGTSYSTSVNITSKLNTLGISPSSLTVDDFVFTVNRIQFRNTYSSGVAVSGGKSSSGAPSFSYSNGTITCKGPAVGGGKYIQAYATFNIYLFT